MPTYHATGVTATLSTCDLQASVSRVIDRKQRMQQTYDAGRLKEVLDAAKPLLERVIADDGSTRGVVQFIGASSDMPLYMVEAGRNLKKLHQNGGPGKDLVAETMLDESAEDVANALPTSSVDSPLTSLGATPTPTQLTFGSSPVKSLQSGQQQTKQDPSSAVPNYSTNEMFQAYATIGPQALVLDITLTDKSFVPIESMSSKGFKILDYQDLKIEVFLNGELVEVDYVSGRVMTTKSPKIMLQFTGTRLHRQVEKPWAYVQSNTITGIKDADDRWGSVSAALINEIDIRGRDQRGDTPPSAEYLNALAHSGLPDRLKECEGLGIIDVVITAGKGMKHGAGVGYSTAPTRMDDRAYTNANPAIDPTMFSSSTAPGPSTPSRSLFVLEDSSPDVPLARTRETKLEFARPAYASDKTIDDLANDLGLDVDLKETLIGSFENAKGRGNPKARSLLQRLGDVKKMTPENQKREIAMLREEYGATNASMTIEEPAQKKVKLVEPDVGFEWQHPPPPNPIASLFDDGTMSPLDMLMPDTPTRIAFEALNHGPTANEDPTHRRLSLARHLGADPNGYLMQSITSASSAGNTPEQNKIINTPQKRTKASALANSPTRVPVKVPKAKGRPKTPQNNDLRAPIDDTAIPFDPYRPTMSLQTEMKAATRAAKAATKATKVPKLLAGGAPSRGAGRSAGRWLPGEKTIEEAVQEFEVPALSVGSCATYGPDLGAIGGAAAVGGKVQRQVGKSRGGEFRERELVVGMRFCVV